jgi:cyclic pyranopterin phosphate synthase
VIAAAAEAEDTAPVVHDTLGRPLRDVRISVTDRCNFRCAYCMPRAAFPPGHVFLPRAQTMTSAEIVRLGRLLVDTGVRTVRLTGGEPLLRNDLEEIVHGLVATRVPDLALTTNGSLLSARAQGLRDAGLHRLTVSLDSLDPDLHSRVSDSGVGVATVLAGIDAATSAGFAPIKLNAVVRRGVNDGASVLDLVDFARRHSHTMRFIEYMDVGESNGWRRADVVSGAEILALITQRYEVERVGPTRPGEVAQRYRYADGAGELGLIMSVTQPFCGGCTRLRVSADGRLHTCLFSTIGTDLLGRMRAGGDDAEIVALLRGVWEPRRDRYSEERHLARPKGRRIEMSYIGG